MSAFDGQDLFGSGPCAVRADGWPRAIRRRGMAGLNGELVLDMGRRSRRVVQTGRLQASDAPSLRTLVAAIEAAADGQTHTLVDDAGRTYPNLIVERFELTTPIRRGRDFWCEYRLEYLQLPGQAS